MPYCPAKIPEQAVLMGGVECFNVRDHASQRLRTTRRLDPRRHQREGRAGSKEQDPAYVLS